MTLALGVAPSTALRAVPLPRFAGEDKQPATAGAFFPPMSQSGGGAGPPEGRWREHRLPNPQ